MRCQDIYAKNDTFISMKNKYKNYSKAPYLLVGEDRNFRHIKDIDISFMQFDLSTILESKEINKAELYLYINSNSFYKDDFLFELEIYLISSPYESSRINFKNSPNIEKTNCGGIINNCKNNGYIIVDVLPIVRHWIKARYPNNGIALFGRSPNTVLSLSSSKGVRSPFLRITSNCISMSSKYYQGCTSGNSIVDRENIDILETQKVREIMNDTGQSTLENDMGEVGSQGRIIEATGGVGLQGLRGITSSMSPKEKKDEIDIISLQGLREIIGITGPRGEKGETGAIGPQGLRGIIGVTGPKGEKGETGAIGPQGIRGVTGPSGESGIQNFAQFAIESSINVNSGQFIPFNNIFIVGENIRHLEGSTDILLTQNHSYFISWSITSLPSNLNFQVGGQIVLNGERVFQSATRNSIIETIQEVSMNNSCIINCENKQNIIQLRYYSNTERIDEIAIAELCIIEIK